MTDHPITFSSSAFARENHPHVGAIVPRSAAIVAEDDIDGEAGALEAPRHLTDRERAERQREPVLPPDPVPGGDVALVEDGEAARAILRHRFDQRDPGLAA